MKKILFANHEGKEIYEYILSNEKIEAHILNYGGILKNLIIDNTDVVCGFDTLEDYILDTSYQGALIGRYANRIRASKFTLNGKEYNVGKNEGNNHLHGGIVGFNRKVWNVDDVTDSSITLSLFSPDGEEGYPGNVSISVTYKLCDAAICIDYTGKTDADTVLNMTNHAYFNLNGCGNGTILDHELRIDADYYTVVDEELLPVGRARVEATPFDLRKFKAIGKDINDEFIGYDHNFVINENAPTENLCGYSLKKIAVSTNGKLNMSVYTNQTGVQLYAGLTLGGTPIFKGGAARVNYGAFCLETQLEPDSPNHGDGFLRANETYRHVTVYKFDK